VLPASATVPILLLIAAEAAWFEVHVKVALDPTVTVAGEAANVTVGAAGGGGLAAEDPHPLNPPVVKVKTRYSNN
jgi:hypothetical protein